MLTFFCVSQEGPTWTLLKLCQIPCNRISGGQVLCSMLSNMLHNSIDITMSKTSAKNQKYVLKRASSGLGLFAVTPFKKGEFVIEYVGEMLDDKELEKRNSNKYFFEIDKDCTVDGSGRENTARYINHSCRPNCEVRIYAKRIRIWTIKRIMSDDEITYDYDKEYFNEYIKPHGCKCASCRKKGKRVF